MSGRTAAEAEVVSERPASSDDQPDQDVRAVLAIPQFRQLWVALGLSSLGDWLGLLATMGLAGSLAAGSYQAELFAVSGVLLLRLAPAVILGPIAGVVADRWNRRIVLVLGDLLRFGLFASIAIVGTLQWLYIATVLIECVALFWTPAMDAAIPNMVPRKRLEAATRLNLVASYGTAPIGAAIYAILAWLSDTLAKYDAPQFDPINVALWINALSFLVSGLVIWQLKVSFTPGDGGRETSLAEPGAGESGALKPGALESGALESGGGVARDEQGMWRNLTEGFRFLGQTPVIRGLVTGLLGAFAAGGCVVALAPAFVRELGAGQAGFGVLFGAIFVGLALGMWVGPKFLVSLPRRKLFGVCLMAAGVLLILMALVPNIALVAVFTVGLGFSAGLAWVTGYTLIGLEVDDELRGRTFSFVGAASRVVLVLVLAAAPALAAVLGQHVLRFPWGGQMTFSGVILVLAMAGVLALVLGWVAYRQMAPADGSSLRRSVSGLVDTSHPLGGVERPREFPGYLIAFEGGDGTGKSTQARALAQWLREELGHEVVLTREPGATRLGAQLRELLLDGEPIGSRAEALLFAADRAHHVDSLIRPALERGAIVITDRYVDSSIAYQGVGRGLSERDIASISAWATDGLTPDLTVLLDIPLEIARVRRANDPKRGGDDRMESEPEDFHEAVRQAFLSLARSHPQRYLVLDGSDDRDDVQQTVRRRVRDLLPISPKRRAILTAKLSEEHDDRVRRAAAEAEVLRLDAELRGRQRDAEREQELAERKAREEAERLLREETERLEREAREAAEAKAAEEAKAAAEAAAAAEAKAKQEAAAAAKARAIAEAKAKEEAAAAAKAKAIADAKAAVEAKVAKAKAEAAEAKAKQEAAAARAKAAEEVAAARAKAAAEAASQAKAEAVAKAEAPTAVLAESAVNVEGASRAADDAHVSEPAPHEAPTEAIAVIATQVLPVVEDADTDTGRDADPEPGKVTDTATGKAAATDETVRRDVVFKATLKVEPSELEELELDQARPEQLEPARRLTEPTKPEPAKPTTSQTENVHDQNVHAKSAPAKNAGAKSARSNGARSTTGQAKPEQAKTGQPKHVPPDASTAGEGEPDAANGHRNGRAAASGQAWFVAGADEDTMRWNADVLAHPAKPNSPTPFPARVEVTPAAITSPAVDPASDVTTRRLRGGETQQELAPQNAVAVTAPLSVAALAATVSGASSDMAARGEEAAGSEPGDEPQLQPGHDPTVELQAAELTSMAERIGLTAPAEPQLDLADEIFGWRDQP